MRALLSVAEWVRERGSADTCGRRPPGEFETTGPGASAHRVGGACAGPAGRSGSRRERDDESLSRGEVRKGVAS